MINTMRTLILRNTATRLIFVTGATGFVMMVIRTVMLLSPALAQSLSLGVPANVQQRVLVVLSLMLFLLAHVQVRFERQVVPRFIDFVLDFWQFRPVRERTLSYRLLEWAHFSLIVLMFHRALFQ